MVMKNFKAKFHFLKTLSEYKKVEFSIHYVVGFDLLRCERELKCGVNTKTSIPLTRTMNWWNPLTSRSQICCRNQRCLLCYIILSIFAVSGSLIGC